CAWGDEDDDDILPDATRELTAWIETKIPEWLDGGSGESYLPLLMNDAMGDQNVTGSYRDCAKFKALQVQNDPDGILSTRVGGFKY
ncbi:fad dependent, partial [Fusarium albosuccineum]